MGCSYITSKSQVKINEVDISGEATKPYKNEINVTNFLQEKSDDIVIVNDLKKIGKVKKANNKMKEKIEEYENIIDELRQNMDLINKLNSENNNLYNQNLSLENQLNEIKNIYEDNQKELNELKKVYGGII